MINYVREISTLHCLYVSRDLSGDLAHPIDHSRVLIKRFDNLVINSISRVNNIYHDSNWLR